MHSERTGVCYRAMLVSAALLGASAVGLLGGCASRPESASERPEAGADRVMAARGGSPTAAALVFETPGQRYALTRAGGEAPSETWAFSRNDGALAVRSEGAILATDQWPQRWAPPERPVRFRRWVQH